MNFSISVRTILAAASTALLMLGLSGCAGYQTPKMKVQMAGANFDLCRANYRSDADLRAFSDFLIVPSVTYEMTADSSRPDTAQRSLIRRMTSNEMSCRRRFAREAIEALKYSGGDSQLTIALIFAEFIRGTENALNELAAGGSTYGQYFSALEDSITKTKKIAIVSVVASEMSYQQRRQAAIDRTMENVQRGMQENCIGCAFSKENRKKTGSSIVTQRSNGVLQGQEVSGANKICRYNQNGSTNYVTVKAHELCPLSSTHDDTTDESFNSNGVFKSSYVNGLNKVCVYDQYGSKNVITVGLTERCPD